MRPPLTGDGLASSRPRKQSAGEVEVTIPSVRSSQHAGPTAFFLATEEDMMKVSQTTSEVSVKDSNYGVKSLAETIDTLGSSDSMQDAGGTGQSELQARQIKSTTPPDGPFPHAFGSNGAGVSSIRTQKSNYATQNFGDLGGTFTPLSLQSPVLESSVPSSPKSTSTRSLRPSDDESPDDAGSQAVISSDEDDIEARTNLVESSTPQLIMPSIKMPSRRPFTERGKSMGRLKILIAGDSGVGKTSLIKSIVQTCEDIVHVDPLSSNPLSVESLPARTSKGRSGIAHQKSTLKITEVYASTRPYPSWFSEFEESTVLRRRKSSEDAVLERNLCFVDTPGYSHGMSNLDGIESITQYITSQMVKTTSVVTLNDGELLRIFGGGGGPQVDVVIYMFSDRINSMDIEFIRRLSMLTNIIPVIAKADRHTESEIIDIKSSFIHQVTEAGFQPFAFTSDRNRISAPFSVSSIPSNDDSIMDASLLMSPDYVQPLLHSDLNTLVDQIFKHDHVSWLKHSAAKRSIQWLRSSQSLTLSNFSSGASSIPSFPHDYSVSKTYHSPSTSTISASQALIPHSNGPLSYTGAKIADHTQREERLAQIHLANWAGNLQRSLNNERAKYETLARREQGAWLTERLDEYRNIESSSSSTNTALVPTHEKAAMNMRGHTSIPTFTNLADPLGLMRLNETMKTHGWVAIQVIGGVGVLGAVAVWIAKQWSQGLTFRFMNDYGNGGYSG